MKGYKANIEKETLKNKYFRKVLFTGKYCQLVVMNLKPGEEIGLEVHDTVDQFFRFEEGNAEVKIGGTTFKVKSDDVVIVPAGSKHNIINSSKSKNLKLYTIYSPPNHPKATVHKNKKEAEEAEKKHHK
ncbi:cupin [Candidatus Woesebacteria bacterium RBG_16_34_12]|uniref:Cupin n=1 Tax=Candidatus Woesebacteria bacterium RBG_16_34_12 TaxID=1802480 RepID=A0A1F7X7Y3_9BACT|nr:MAG: cupin [Candidatus Woesebacteria bacterium RBG_16_34_12]